MAQYVASSSVNNANTIPVTPVLDPTPSLNFESGKPHLVQCFPHHDTMKLYENNFIQWQQHVRLIVEGYELTGFLEGTLTTPPQFVQNSNGELVSNLEASVHG